MHGQDVITAPIYTYKLYELLSPPSRIARLLR